MSDKQAQDEQRRYQVLLREEHAVILEALAAREGSSPEALAALWLEEKADEARALLRGAPAAGEEQP